MVGYRVVRLVVLCALAGALSAKSASGQEAIVYGDLSDFPPTSGSHVRQIDGARNDSFLSSEMWGASQEALDVPRFSGIRWPSHLRHGDPADPRRSVGIGDPLVTTSWRNRPFHIGWLYGGLRADNLVQNQIAQDDDMFGGYRLGWDFDHFWGTELRFGFTHLNLTNLSDPTDMLPTARNHFWDLNLLYYPWGDARWRPFATLGLGVGAFRFQDANASLFDDILLSIPIGVGVKYYYRPWLALRATVIDHWSIGSQGIATMHNVSLTTGVEVHFGGPRTGYFPYHPGGYIW